MKNMIEELLLYLLVFFTTSSAFRRHQFMNEQVRKDSSSVVLSDTITYNYTVNWYKGMPVDHFNYRNTLNFSLRYLTNFDSFKQEGGVIFFYAGNEGGIESFAENTGIMWDLAPMFKAAIVFAEHRFYGETLPFGNESYTKVEHLGYLDAIQALADYAELIIYIKLDVLKCSDSTPVIVFGGSYGGMLAGWLRMKYPHIVNGSWASSAPIRYFVGGANPEAFDNVTTRTFVNSGCSREAIVKGFAALKNMSKTAEGRKSLNEIFKLDPTSALNTSEGFWPLYYYIQNAMVGMAMVDYPYPANFLGNLPGWPVKYACQHAKETPKEDRMLAIQLYNIINVNYNYTGKLQYNCFSSNCPGSTAGASSVTENGWTWQECTSMTMMMCDQGGDVDFFLPNCIVNGSNLLEQNKQNCVNEFGDIGYNVGIYQEYAVPIRYGMNYAAASNIVFTNGALDPWSGGGVYADSPGVKYATKNGVYTIYMNDSAHHLDLRQPNTCDPPSVTRARYEIVNILKCWVNSSCTTLPKVNKLPTNENWKWPGNCKFIKYGYPWEQSKGKNSWHSQSSVLLVIFSAFIAFVQNI